MSDLTLLSNAASPPARSVLLLLQYFKSSINIEHIDFNKGEHLTEKFLTLNPLHTVPTFYKQAEGATEPELVLYESAAMIEYLSDVFKWDGKYGMPSDMSAKYAVINMLHNHGNFIGQAIREIFIKNIYGPANGRTTFDVDMLKETIASVEDKFATFNSILERKGGFVTGPTPTCADVRIWVDLFNMSTNGGQKYSLGLVDFSKKYPAIFIWLEALKADFFGQDGSINTEIWASTAMFVTFVENGIGSKDFRLGEQQQ